MLELRQDGDGAGIIFGTALVYGQPSLPLTASGLRERIEAGAFGQMTSAIFANIGHRRDRLLGRYPDGGLILRDTPERLRFELTLPDTMDGRDAATLVRQRILTGVSIEFIRRKTYADGRVLVVTQGALRGISLVDRPAYPRSQVEQIRQLMERSDKPAPRVRKHRRWLV